jgi:hypothetical protein
MKNPRDRDQEWNRAKRLRILRQIRKGQVTTRTRTGAFANHMVDAPWGIIEKVFWHRVDLSHAGIVAHDASDSDAIPLRRQFSDIRLRLLPVCS